MKILYSLPWFDFSGGVVATIISVVVCFAIIGGLIFYVKRSKKRKNMVHNRKKPNDNPENRNLKK